jgi:hypothetical protein
MIIQAMSSVSTLGAIHLTEERAVSQRRGFSQTPGWLSGRRFDLLFVVATATIGLAAGFATHFDHALFGAILFADLWLLGYHHVIATYTRTAFDSESFARYKPLLTWLPMAVIGVVLLLALGVGAWTIPTVYLYWQWWHYTRQSYGVAQMYRLKTPQSKDSGWEMRAALYLLPLAGILYRSYQDPGKFLGMELRVIPVPLIAVEVAGAAAAVSIAWWLVKQYRAWRIGELPLAYNLYMASHVAVFGVGYIAISNINYGWLTINIWHNAQYILVVWLYNRNRFKTGVSTEHRWLSTLSQPQNVAKYFGATLGLTVVAYLTLGTVFVALPATTLPLALIAYQTLNFHHYVVDSVIWKVRKPQMRKNMGLEQLAA